MPSDPNVDFDELLFEYDYESDQSIDLLDEPDVVGVPIPQKGTEDISPTDTVSMDDSSCVFTGPARRSAGPSSHEVSRIDYPSLSPLGGFGLPELADPDGPVDEVVLDPADFVGDGAGESTGDRADGAAPREGESFGRYRIRRSLGEGAMGAVYLADDTVLERGVALKLPNLAEDDPEMLERFRTEARIAATLRHPNICPVYDVGDVDGRHYISMAFIPGRPLSNYARSKYRHPVRQVVKVVRKLAFALHAAHQAGIVHRDVKPANVMIDDSREPILMDFGLARKTDPSTVRLTQAGAVLGTPAYMSPEQVEGRIDEVGPPSDQFSLGAVLYELLTGKLPFDGTSLASVMARILRETPPPIRSLRKSVDEELAGICDRMLSKPVEERFDSLADVAEELGEWLKKDKERSGDPTRPSSGGSESESRTNALEGNDDSSRGEAGGNGAAGDDASDEPAERRSGGDEKTPSGAESSRIRLAAPAEPAKTKLVRRRAPGAESEPAREPSTSKPASETIRARRAANRWQWLTIVFGLLALAMGVRTMFFDPAPNGSAGGAVRIQVGDPKVTVEIDGRTIEISDARRQPGAERGSSKNTGEPREIRIDDTTVEVPSVRSTFRVDPTEDSEEP